MLQEFDPGDYLIFQIESGYGLLRVLAVEGPDEDPVWHVAAYDDLFLDAETADAGIDISTLELLIDRKLLQLCDKTVTRY